MHACAFVKNCSPTSVDCICNPKILRTEDALAGIAPGVMCSREGRSQQTIPESVGDGFLIFFLGDLVRMAGYIGKGLKKLQMGENGRKSQGSPEVTVRVGSINT
jgi:hypothetical protein